MNEFFKGVLGKKEKFGARSRWDNAKSPTESPKYFGNTIKAMADNGRSNSVLGESAGNRGDGPVFRENNHAKSHLHKNVCVNFRENGGNFWGFANKKYFNESLLLQQNLLKSNSEGLSRHKSRCTIG